MPRYVMGIDNARSSLTVPLRLNDQIIGVFNIESEKAGAFSEEERQFAEIFARYVAMTLHILDLLVMERRTVTGRLADNVAVGDCRSAQRYPRRRNRADGGLHRPRRPAASAPGHQ